MLARLDAVKVSERHDQPNRAMPAHAEIADVIEEDDARRARWIHRLADTTRRFR